MPPSDIELRIFVIGVPRSGTTLVQSLLAAHSGVTSFTESHFFSRHFSLLPPSSSVVLTRDPVPSLREFLDENGFGGSEGAEEIDERVRRLVPAAPFLRSLRTRAVARELLRSLDQLALVRGSSTWVEKTPRHLRYAPFLGRLYGGQEQPRFVHVIRRGLETVASLYTASRSWERSYDLQTCVRRWNADVGFSLDRASLPSDAFVFYEDLTAHPEATMRRLIEWLDLDWEPEILERYADASSELVTSDEVWKGNVAREVRSSATSADVLSAQERERVTTALRQDIYAELHQRTA